MEEIGVGQGASNAFGDDAATAFTKINSNFRELEERINACGGCESSSESTGEDEGISELKESVNQLSERVASLSAAIDLLLGPVVNEPAKDGEDDEKPKESD